MNSKKIKNRNAKAKSDSILSDIKSKYILQKIFDNLKVKTLLRIINYNHKLQKKWIYQ